MAYVLLVSVESFQTTALPCVKTAQGRHLAAMYTIRTHTVCHQLATGGGFQLPTSGPQVLELAV